eukprot:5883561-Prorocentrum_lima.AAC.1
MAVFGDEMSTGRANKSNWHCKRKLQPEASQPTRGWRPRQCHQHTLDVGKRVPAEALLEGRKGE